MTLLRLFWVIKLGPVQICGPLRIVLYFRPLTTNALVASVTFTFHDKVRQRLWMRRRYMLDTCFTDNVFVPINKEGSYDLLNPEYTTNFVINYATKPWTQIMQSFKFALN